MAQTPPVFTPLLALREVKVQPKLSLTREVKCNMKGFCKFTGDKRNSVCPLVNEARDLEEAGELKAFFALVFINKTHEAQKKATIKKKLFCFVFRRVFFLQFYY